MVENCKVRHDKI